MSSPVIDLSHHNPTPDWSKMKAAGVVGVILKCTEGATYLDPTYGQRANDAARAGLLVAPYHFLKRGSVSQQMDWFLSRAGPPKGGRVVLDHEGDATLDQLCEAVIYLGQVRPDCQVTIYSGSTIKDQLGDNTVRAELSHTSLWIAHYASDGGPSWPTQQWSVWSLWQWTDRETVPGISQPVDGNEWNGTPDALVKWMSPASDAPSPEPTPAPEADIVSIDLPDNLRLFVNGIEVKIP